MRMCFIFSASFIDLFGSLKQTYDIPGSSSSDDLQGMKINIFWNMLTDAEQELYFSILRL